MTARRCRLLLIFACIFVATAPAFAQPLPDGAIARLGKQHFVTQGGAGIALSPDGKLLASARFAREGQPGAITIWDVESAKVVRETEPGDIFEQSWGSLGLAWSANGRHIAAASWSRIQVWDAYTGRRRTPDKKPQPGIGFSSISTFRFVAKDRLALAGRKYDSSGFRVEIWDVLEGTYKAAWTFDKSKWESLPDDYEILHVALSPSGERMAWLAGPLPNVKDGKSIVYVYETATDRLLHTLTDLPRAFRIDLPDEGETLLMHPLRSERVEKITTGQAAVVSVADGKVRFHCPYRFQPAAQFHTPNFVDRPGYVTSGHINREAVRFRDSLVVPDELGLTRWDLKDGKKLDELDEPFSGMAMSADGRRLAVRENKRIGTTAGSLADLHNRGVLAHTPKLKFLPDGRLLLNDSDHTGGGLMQIWDPHKCTVVQTSRVFRRPETSGSVLGASSYDAWGKTATAILGNEQHRNLVTYDLVANQSVSVVKGVSRARVSGDGKRLLINTFDGPRERLIVHWVDARTGQNLGRHDIPYKDLHGTLANFLRDAEWLAEDGSAFGYMDASGCLALFDCAQGKVVATMGITPAKDWRDPVWQPQSAGRDRLLWVRPRFYDLYSGVNHDNKDAAEYAIWDRQGRLLRRFAVPARRLWEGQELLSPDGRTMAVGLSGKTIGLIETASGRMRGSIPIGFTYGLNYDSNRDLWLADFSPDSKLLATSCFKTSTVLLWDLARPLAEAALPAPKSAKEAAALWDRLGHPDPMESVRALWALVAAPAPTLAVLQDGLKPMSVPDAKRLQTLIKDLRSVLFKVREAASNELLSVKTTALPELRAARKTTESLEEARRLDVVIEALQTRLESPGAILRELRALEVLERIGSADARRQVEAVAVGFEGVLAHEAQLILARWQTAVGR